MRGLKRDPALVALSRDHHFALRQVLWLRRAAAGADAGRAVAVGRDFLAFHRAELVPHMGDEEAEVFPAFEPFDPEATARLRREHREIEALAAQLAAVLDEGRDPAGVMIEIASLLDDHVRYEERGYFMAVQERLDAAALREVGARLERRRRDRSAGLDQTSHGSTGGGAPSSH
jgi:hypothetical protein